VEHVNLFAIEFNDDKEACIDDIKGALLWKTIAY
jgi:hypothetical protein